MNEYELEIAINKLEYEDAFMDLYKVYIAQLSPSKEQLDVISKALDLNITKFGEMSIKSRTAKDKVRYSLCTLQLDYINSLLMRDETEKRK